MGKNKKKKNYQRILNNKKKTSNNNKTKKILDGVDLANFKDQTSKKDEYLELVNTKEIINLNQDNKIDKKNENIDKIPNNDKESFIRFNFNENIQNIISILFTIIIFIAFILLIYVLYDNYLKKKDENICDVNKVCQEYIKKDYNINEDDVINYIKSIRGIIYNLDEFNIKTIDNDDYLELITYFIWNLDMEYLICDHSVDSNCLITKKEIEKENLNKYFKKYLNIEKPEFTFSNSFTNEDKIRLYEFDKKIVLSFSEFTYDSLKHDIVDIRIDKDNIYIIFALGKNLENSELYSYVGYKKLELKYLDKRFIIQNIKTNLSE